MHGIARVLVFPCRNGDTSCLSRKPRGSHASFTVPATATQVDVAMTVRERGLEPYRVRFDSGQAAWVVRLIDWQRAA